MASDIETELIKTMRAHDDRYDYFLLAAAGASIAFALNQTKGLALSWSQIALGVAGACWAFSFFIGCLRLRRVRHGLYINSLLVQKQNHEPLMSIPIARQTISDAAKSSFAKADNAAVLYGKLQFAFLIAGGLSYIAWHVNEMYWKAVAH